MNKPTKKELIEKLRELLGEAFAMHRRGEAQTRLGRTYGYADGYMRVLLDTGVVTETELLSIVAQVRSTHAGPATKTLAA